jgi:putative endonuclease
MARHNEIGRIGEDIAVNRLVTNGYMIVERNYAKKWGEIDIVARMSTGRAGGTDDVLHFIEVKTVSYETSDYLKNSVSHETWRPEEKVHRNKLLRLRRAIETWLLEHESNDDFQIDVITVRVVPREKYAVISLIENIIIE